jgi:octanoyl-[GcvH]:protein N-octanoyltransferase
MNEAEALLKQPIWRIIDQTALGAHFSALHSFASDDTLCASVGSGNSPATARAWIHPQTVVLGIQDTKLPHLKDGLDYLQQQGYTSIVRNSGGLAVVLDEGVLNLTLVFPEQVKKIEINRGYDAMWQLVKQMFRDFPHQIEAREINGSYCPGSYDLSIAGKKFAGISQRRLRKGVAVQIYLCVSGSGKKRAELIKNFYSYGIKGDLTKIAFPEVNPEVMASLSKLIGVELSINDVMLRFLQSLKEYSGQLYSGQLTEEELQMYTDYFLRINERNHTMLAK